MLCLVSKFLCHRIFNPTITQQHTYKDRLAEGDFVRECGMGRLDVIVPDDLEREFRVKVAELLGGEKGAISKAVTEGIRLWMKQTASKRK